MPDPKLPDRPYGFTGRRSKVAGEIEHLTTHTHVVRLVMYEYEAFNGVVTEEPYVEIVELKGEYRGTRIVHLSDVVHALLNLKPDELWQVGARRKDWEDKATGDQTDEPRDDE